MAVFTGTGLFLMERNNAKLAELEIKRFRKHVKEGNNLEGLKGFRLNSGNRA